MVEGELAACDVKRSWSGGYENGEVEGFRNACRIVAEATECEEDVGREESVEEMGGGM